MEGIASKKHGLKNPPVVDDVSPFLADFSMEFSHFPATLH
jgi:hypothetical protein